MASALHLDTNVLIFGLDPHHPARDQFHSWSSAGDPVAVSAMAWAEFRCGPVTQVSIRAWERAIGDDVIPLDRAIAELAASLFNQTGRRSRSLSDCLIAATAIRYGARLATLNRGDFEPLLAHGLVLA